MDPGKRQQFFPCTTVTLVFLVPRTSVFTARYELSIQISFRLTLVFKGLNTGVLISPYPDQEGNKLMFLSEWREFPSAPCLAGVKNLMTARVSMLLKSRASLTFFRACFLPGLAKDFSAPWVYWLRFL